MKCWGTVNCRQSNSMTRMTFIINMKNSNVKRWLNLILHERELLSFIIRNFFEFLDSIIIILLDLILDPYVFVLFFHYLRDCRYIRKVWFSSFIYSNKVSTFVFLRCEVSSVKLESKESDCVRRHPIKKLILLSSSWRLEYTRKKETDTR